MSIYSKIKLTPRVEQILANAKSVTIPNTKQELFSMVFGEKVQDRFDVGYSVPGAGFVVEANVTRCTNGAVVNYMEDYMRRRDPDCMRIGDDLPSDKPRFNETYNMDFEDVREETYKWLEDNDLIVVPFKAGGTKHGYLSIAICPKNAAFFALAIADLQGFVSIADIDAFTPRSIIYVAPPFRHTHFDGRQVVVHSRSEDLHEVFSYNLYPGPSAKKGVYSVLLDIGEKEGWVTAHASAVKVVTPYENEVVIMHEGASGGGKSEMLEEVHREADRRLLLGVNTHSGERTLISLSETCILYPITDDMALCHNKFKNDSGKLVLTDAEEGWFLRVDHITAYGSDYQYEKISIHPDEPLIFFNIIGNPGATCLIWEHTLDSTGKKCPNPRVVIPRRLIKNIVTEPAEVDIRSFGVRMPPCTNDNPTYGIMGLLHIIPPALAWLWRLVAPRGHNNPSIVDSGGMISEGVGSYWPFATGSKITQANLLLRQIISTPKTNYILIPNQHIGVYKVGFASEWVAREYLARRGSAVFPKDKLLESRCALLGYNPKELKIDGQYIREKFLRTDMQDIVGTQGYDKGAKILEDFFKKELIQFDTPELDPIGREIIAVFKRGGSIDDYIKIIPMNFR